MPPSHPVTPRFPAPCTRAWPLLLTAALLVAPSCASDSGSVGDPAGEGDPGGDPGTGGGGTTRALSACYFAADAVYCGPVDDDARVRVKDFYPSACIDGDHDRDRVPDFMDMDDPGGDYDDDEHRCRSCNRGPGGGGDFRFETDGSEARLDRGLVYAYDGEQDSLIVPTPGGEALTIMISSDTRVDDGYPAPGDEIRAEGEIDVDGVLWAERVKVLCDAPDALSPDDVPPDCEAVDPHE